MQGDIQRKNYGSLSETAAALYKVGGNRCGFDAHHPILFGTRRISVHLTLLIRCASHFLYDR
jgi:hypothetical protein